MNSSPALLTGDAPSIQASADSWSAFSAAASLAGSDIRAVDSGDFQGDEADLYREKLNSDLPPHLDAVSEAWTIVANALKHYSATLEHLQSRMLGLSARAIEQHAQVDSAESAVAEAVTADARHSAAINAAGTPILPGQIPPPDDYRSPATDAAIHLQGRQSALQSTIDAADRARVEHSAAVDDCVAAINRAAGARFEEPPGFWGRLSGSVGGWITHHADVLKSVSSVLRTISGITGLLAMIPVLSPVMGPIALATAGGALLIDATLKVATGEGSWTGIVVDAGLMVLPGAGKLLKAAVLATKTGQAVDETAARVLAIARESSPGRALAALKNTKAGAAFSAPGKGLDWVNTKVADGLSHLPGANRLPGVKVELSYEGADVTRAEGARDAAGLKPNGTLDRYHGAYLGATKDGQIVVGRAQPRTTIHAEDDAMRQLPGGLMTKAYGWRTDKVTGELRWTELPVCVQCQARYSPEQFVKDINAAPGGAWGR